MINGGFTAELAAGAIDRAETDLVAFGVPFICHPDLVERYRTGAALNPPDLETFYTAGPEGYIDYPPLNRGTPTVEELQSV